MLVSHTDYEFFKNVIIHIIIKNMTTIFFIIKVSVF